MGRTNIPRASISCALPRDLDYLKMVSEDPAKASSAVGIFALLICVAKDQENDGTFECEPSVAAKFVSLPDQVFQDAFKMLSRWKWLETTKGGFRIRSYEKWNPKRDGWGGARKPSKSNQDFQDESKMNPSCAPSDTVTCSVTSTSKKKSRRVTAPDDEFLKSLEADPAYEGIDVKAQMGKCARWCEVNGKTFSRRRLVNWLNRAEKPIDNGQAGDAGPYLPRL